MQDQTENAIMHFRRSITVDFNMMLKLIVKLKEHDIQYLIAPYEADAQLAWLSRHDLIDLVISEDSDCLPYGCKRVSSCAKPTGGKQIDGYQVVFKLELDGNGQEIKRKNLGANTGFNFVNWTGYMVRRDETNKQKIHLILKFSVYSNVSPCRKRLFTIFARDWHRSRL